MFNLVIQYQDALKIWFNQYIGPTPCRNGDLRYKMILFTINISLLFSFNNNMIEFFY